jgi:hypothetical protein
MPAASTAAANSRLKRRAPPDQSFSNGDAVSGEVGGVGGVGGGPASRLWEQPTEGFAWAVR